MKRSWNNDSNFEPSTRPLLGASEFASTLNSTDSDPNQILQCLKRFVAIVRQQRKIALGQQTTVSTKVSPAEQKQQQQHQREKNENSDDDSMSSDDDSDSLEERTPDTRGDVMYDTDNKKPRYQYREHERWKEDTAQYNVPFVGTAVSSAGIEKAAAVVVVGQWPTGLLLQYLQKSPLAVELTSNDALLLFPGVSTSAAARYNVHKKLLSQQRYKKHGRKLSQAILKSYLRAIAEIITAVIPPEKLIDNNDLNTTTSTPSQIQIIQRTWTDIRYITEIMNKRLPTFFHLLRQECTGDDSSKGELAYLVLRIITNLSVTSQSIARTIVRQLHNPRILPEDVVRFLICPYSSNKKTHERSSNNNKALQSKNKIQSDNDDDDDDDDDDDTIQAKRGEEKEDIVKKKEEIDHHLKCRIATMELVCTFMQMNDTSIFNTICTTMSYTKDRNSMNAGILYIALKDGLQKKIIIPKMLDNNMNQNHIKLPEQEWIRVVYKLLCNVRQFLDDDDCCISKRSLNDLFSKDTIQHIGHLIVHAPPYDENLDDTSNNNNDFLQQNDDKTYYNYHYYLHQVGIESRNIIFRLLDSKNKSPILQLLQRRSNNLEFKGITAYNESIIVRAMIILLEEGKGNTNTANLAIQRFMIQCITKTPELLPMLFKVISIPDPNVNKNNDGSGTFAFLSRINFISKLIQDGPSVSLCCCLIPTPDNSSTKEENETSFVEDPHVVLSIIPRALKKQTIVRAIQNSNPFIVAQTLKLLIFVLQRCKQYLVDLNQCNNMNFRRILLRALNNNIPDLTVILATLSNFELSYHHHNPSNNKNNVKSNAFVYGLVCEVLRAFTDVFPHVIRECKFDWMKIMPSDTMSFSRAPMVIQRSILHAIMEVIMIQETIQNFQTNFFRSVLMALLRTRSNEVMKILRNLSVAVIQKLWGDQGNSQTIERLNVFAYEASCWVDGVTIDTLDDFCSVLKDSLTNASMAFVTVAQSWKDANLPYPDPAVCFSPLLIQAIRKIESVSHRFCIFTCQTAINCMLYMTNPLTLASFILSYSNMACQFTQFRYLCDYARVLVKFHECSSFDRMNILNRLMQSCFSNETFLLEAKLLTSQKRGTCDLVPFAAITNKRRILPFDYITCTRQLAHVISVLDETSIQDYCFDLLRQLLPGAVKASTNDELHGFLPFGMSFHRRLGMQRKSIDFIFLTSGIIRTMITGSDALSEVLLGSAIAAIRNCTSHKSKDFRRAVYWLYFSAPFLNVRTLMEVLCIVLGAHLDLQKIHVNHTKTLVTQYLKLFMQQNFTEDLYNKKVSDAMGFVFRLYEFVTSIPMLNPSLAELGIAAEQVLCRYLSAGQMPWFMSNTSASNLVGFVLRFGKEVMNNKKDHQSQGCFLEAMVLSDPVRFIPELFNCLSTCPIDEYEKIVESGSLDRILLKASSFTQMPEGEILQNLLDRTLLRAEKLISSKLPNDECLENTTSVLVLFAMKGQIMNCSNIDKLFYTTNFLTRDVTKASTRFDKYSRKTKLNIFQIALTVCQTNNSKTVASALLHRCAPLLPQSLRAHMKGNPSASASRIIKPMALLGLLRDMFQSRLEYDLRYIETLGTDFVYALIRACLRYGIDDRESIKVNVQLLCTELVSLLLLVFNTESTGITGLSGSLVSSLPSQVFEMITTHSKFPVIMLRSDNERLPLRFEICRILARCLSSANNIPFDDNVWKILMSSFNAGVTELDKILRYIIYVYWKQAPENSSVVYLDQWRWGLLGTSRQSNDDWGWLVDSIELSRVYATISEFPINESLAPNYFLPQRSGQSSDSEPTEVSMKIQSVEKFIPNLSETEDKLYNPGFLLPLILGALNDDAENNLRERFTESNFYDTEDAPDPENREEPEERQEYNTNNEIQMVQRLCEKGALALALCSLCSNCPSIRRISFAILGLVLAAVDSKEAHQAAHWRERPQIKMLLNAVVRAIVILRAEEETVNTIGISNNYTVPRFSGFAAVFLAKTSLILSRPSDPMYGAANRYFLRSDVDFGAFQDSFKLPAFVFLFCSSAKDPEQLKSERKFAIELVRDGFTDEESYRLLVSSYVPDLLLTSLESVNLGSVIDNEKESLLVLKALTKFINGGKRARHHLIGRLGILPWIRSFLIGRPTLEFLPTVKSRIAILQLTKVVVSHAIEILSIEEINVSTAGLAQAMLELCLQTIRDNVFHRERSELSLLLSCTCDCLVSLANATLKESLSNSELAAEQTISTTNEISLASTTELIPLLRLDNKSLQLATIQAVCTFSFYGKELTDHTEGSVAYRFCTSVLETAIALSEATSISLIAYKDFQLSVLRRVRLVSSYLNKKNELLIVIRKLLSWRRDCSSDEYVRKLWFDCLYRIINHLNKGNSEQFFSDDGALFLAQQALVMEGFQIQ